MVGRRLAHSASSIQMHLWPIPPRMKEDVPNEARESLSVWFRSWRYFFWLLGLLLAVAVFYGEENWRGRRAWNAYQQQLKARGESTDARSFVPESVPVSENFARTPF